MVAGLLYQTPRALHLIADAIRQNNPEKYVNEPDWNLDAHLEGVTLTIRDARAVFSALRGELPPQPEPSERLNEQMLVNRGALIDEARKMLHRAGFTAGNLLDQIRAAVAKPEPSEREFVNLLAKALTESGYGVDYERAVQILSKLSDEDIRDLSYLMYRTGEKIGYDAFSI